MSKIFDQLPYSDMPASVVVGGEQVHVLAHQIIVWISISAKGDLRLGRGADRIPAVFDTGNTFGFSITEELLTRWCGINANMLEILGPVFINRQRLNRHAADIWLHRNQSGKRDKFQVQTPFRLQLRDGIAIYPADTASPAPRLPLLGLRAIDENGLRCTINGRKRLLSLSGVEMD